VSFIILLVVTHVVYASKHTSFSAVAVKFLEFVSKAYIRLNKNPRTNNHVVSFVGKCQMDEWFCSGTRPDYLGVQTNPPSLALCPLAPPCISTSEEANDPAHYIPPWYYRAALIILP
jgi:hypothetical protein